MKNLMFLKISGQINEDVSGSSRQCKGAEVKAERWNKDQQDQACHQLRVPDYTQAQGWLLIWNMEDLAQASDIVESYSLIATSDRAAPPESWP